jgi:hypothetical protein
MGYTSAQTEPHAKNETKPAQIHKKSISFQNTILTLDDGHIG